MSTAPTTGPARRPRAGGTRRGTCPELRHSRQCRHTARGEHKDRCGGHGADGEEHHTLDPLAQCARPVEPCFGLRPHGLCSSGGRRRRCRASRAPTPGRRVGAAVTAVHRGRGRFRRANGLHRAGGRGMGRGGVRELPAPQGRQRTPERLRLAATVPPPGTRGSPRRSGVAPAVSAAVRWPEERQATQPPARLAPLHRRRRRRRLSCGRRRGGERGGSPDSASERAATDIGA